jgi:hypothetical protein
MLRARCPDDDRVGRSRRAEPPPGSGEAPRPGQASAPEVAESEAILCRACGAAITAREHAIDIDGRHAHTFFNPAGVLYEIGCFAAAPGCANAGRPTAAFSWFADYRWRYAFCAGCGAHLGWQFVGRAADAFWGLVLARLIEAGE